MFINLEIWDEELRHDNGQPVEFGSLLDAHLDMCRLKVRHRPINLGGILSFETIRVRTNGRPGTNENKSDALTGVRLLLVDGSQYIVIDDKDPTFVSAIAQARLASEAVYNHGPSAYMQRFGNGSAFVL
ncbi:hypothetical protein BZM26_37225 [Paraburkholderia strydomiana]|nr:hypothetical protein BZM26_37225 [Paraburkholderia strydomiana]